MFSLQSDELLPQSQVLQEQIAREQEHWVTRKSRSLGRRSIQPRFTPETEQTRYTMHAPDLATDRHFGEPQVLESILASSKRSSRRQVLRKGRIALSVKSGNALTARIPRSGWITAHSSITTCAPPPANQSSGSCHLNVTLPSVNRRLLHSFGWQV
jgi:hypothetical protein